MGASLLWGFVFGTVGFGYFVYGKKQQRLPPLLCGIALMVFPYFVTNNVAVVLIGTVLLALPYFLRQ